MLHTDNINYIELSLLESQIDLVLDALQLYAFNFHRVWAVDYDSDKEDLRNSLIFHTYEQIQSKYNSCRYTHKDYDIRDNCKRISKQKVIKKYYSKKVA